MKYYVNRNGQEFGPYSLAELQLYVQTGEVILTDLAKSEAMADWAPVSQVIGNIGATPAVIPPVDYGTVPPYSVFAPAPSAAAAQAYPLPPDLHWVVVLLLTVFTCGLFGWVWMFVQASYVKKIKSDNNTVLFYAIGIAAILLTLTINSLRVGNNNATRAALQIGASVLIIIGHFQMRSALEEHFNSEEPIHLQLSGVMTFFFNTVYFQYHMSRIRRWRTTGVLG